MADQVSPVDGFSSPVPSNVLKGVVAYVEVRTASDNRSAAIKWVLERMGAKVEEKFTNDVTHVIFKEGKKRTRDRALKLGVHLVSVLWVDSCKEKQQRVQENDFSANTQNCETPPPGVRWKKYKSMQPCNFEDDVARSAERFQKRQRKKDLQRHLFQGQTEELVTPYHSPANVLVVDTQARSPLVMRDLLTPFIIPSTPPSIQARLDQLQRQKEAGKHEQTEESPSGTASQLKIPLQRTLFINKSPWQPKDTEDKTAIRQPTSTERSLQSSDRVSSGSISDYLPQKQRNSCLSDEDKPSLDSKSGKESMVSSESSDSGKSHSCAQTSGGVEAAGWTCVESDASDSRNTRRLRRSCNLGAPVSLEVIQSKKTKLVQKRKCVRQSLPGAFLQNSSKIEKQASHSVLSGSGTTALSVTATSQGSDGSHMLKRAHSHSALSSDAYSMGAKSPGEQRDVNDSSRQKKRRRVSSLKNDVSKNRNVVCDEDTSEDPASNKCDQPLPPQTSSLNTIAIKPASKKRKLLNPSQEMVVLSPSPTENPNIPKAAEPEQGKRARKRKSCDVDAVFPSSLPASKRGRTAQVKENKVARRASSQAGPSCNKTSASQSPSGQKTSVDKGRKRSHKEQKDKSGSVSTLCSTPSTFSILGSSMSMMFNESSATSFKLAPPRSSIAEFKTAKPRRQSRQAMSTAGSPQSSSGQGSKPMSLQKFHLTCMPSLVMTSLHRPEQDIIIAAVKRLGVFRIEDKVSKDTTHVVCGEPRRTLNLLHGMARGCWVVSKDWALHSVEKGQWVAEEDYEVTDHMPKVKEARLAREAEVLGTYQCQLFKTIGSLFVSHSCSPPRAQLVKLLQLCGAKVTDSLPRANFYIGDESHDDKTSIKPVWVLDCISQQQLMPMDSYILAINYKAKVSSSPEF